MERLIDADAVESIATGGAFLGTGGGGDPYIGKLMAQRAIERYGPVRLIPPESVPARRLVIPAAMMGTPTVLIEKIPRGDEFLKVVAQMETLLGIKAYATMSIEAGGLNSTVPISVAAALKLPLVDCDGMGRAFPELQMVIPTLHGVTSTPMCMADEKGNALVLSTISNRWTETFARSITVQMGGSAMVALYSMTGTMVRKACVAGSISLAWKIGDVLRKSARRKADPLDRLLKITRGRRLFQGKIVDVLRRTDGAWVRGELKAEGAGADRGQSFTVRFQNENLIALRGDRPVATVPDLITVLDQDSSFPITTEGLKYGQRITVIGMPCNRQWRTAKGLELVGPRYFGYDIDYRPIEELN